MEGAAKDREGGPTEVITVTLKNPTRLQQEGFKLDVDKATTVKDLKQEINVLYPGRPEPSDITVRVSY